MTLAILATLWAGMPLPRLWFMALGMAYYQIKDSPRALILLAVLAISTRFSVIPSWSVYGQPDDWTYGFLPILSYLVLTTTPIGTNWLKWAGVGLSIHALLQVAGLDPLVPLLPAGGAIAWVGTPINLAAVLALATPLAGPWTPLLLAGIWACKSRGALFAVAFAMGNKWARIALAAGMIGYMCLSTKPKDVARVEMVRIAWRGFAERPWFGHGPNTYEAVFAKHRTRRLVNAVGEGYRQGYAHNDIMEALCSTGILGLMAYLFFLWPLRGNPSLVALFVFMKFNPVSFEVFCVAALIAAEEFRKRPLSVFKPRAALSLFSRPSLPYPPERA